MPRMIELIRSSSVPATLMHSAAKGALAVPPGEMMEILVYLATENRVFREQARLTLAGWDEAVSRPVAADPNTPKEVLDYMVSPQNLRPVLLPALLENPAVADATWVEFAASASRENVETMLASARVSHSAAILKALAKNPGLSGIQTTSIEAKLATAGQPASPSAQPEPTLAMESAPTDGTPPPEPATKDEKQIEEGINLYLTEHAKEIAAEGEKPFQPIGGNYEELIVGNDEKNVEEAPAASVKPKPAAAPKKPVVKKPHPGEGEEKRGSTLQKIAALDIRGRIQLAMKGTKEERSLLIRDGTKLVALAVLESPKISDGEVERYAGQKNVLEAVLRAIPMKRRFAKLYPVTRNLVSNPRTPLDVSLGLMKYILVNDLRNLSGNKEVSDTVRKLALKMFKQKVDSSKKNT